MAANYKRKDFYYQQAKASGYRSRAAYKLLELDKRYRIFRKGARVLDLGSYPGGWIQVARAKAGEKGRVVGIDLRALSAFPKPEGSDKLAPVQVVVGDIYQQGSREQLKEALGGRCHVLLTDMSPQLSGIKFRDVARSVALVEAGLQLAEEVLLPGGTFVAKLFPGSDSDEFVNNSRKLFKSIRRVNLESTRRSSNEFYMVATGYKFEAGE